MKTRDEQIDSQDGASKASDNITVALTNMHTGREEGDNSRPGQARNESRDLGSTKEHPLGTGEPKVESQQGIDIGKKDDDILNLAEIEQRFISATMARLKPSVQKDYLIRFRRFARGSKLAECTRRQLAGPKGKQLIIEHLGRIPKTSWCSNLACIHSVWTYGIKLPWPIDNRMDIGRLPKPRREPTPSNDPVREWAEAVAREKDPFLRLVWLLIAQHGWRPSHATGVRWQDVRFDSSGRPYAIISQGDRGEFKTYAPLAVRLAPDVVNALTEWCQRHPAPHPEGWILPFRSLRGGIDPSRRLQTNQFRKLWILLRKKYELPPLRPKDMRHWVSTTCRKAGLSKPATAYMQGHDITGAGYGGMRDWYDNPPLEEFLNEQESHLPDGPLGLLVPFRAEIFIERPSDALALLDAYLAGAIGTMEFANSIEAVRRKGIQKPIA